MHKPRVFAFALSMLGPCFLQAAVNTNLVTTDAVEAASKLFGLQFSGEKEEMMLPDLRRQLSRYDAVRTFPLSNGVPPALVFDPAPAGMKFDTRQRKIKWSKPGKVVLPADLNELAFYSVGQLAELIRTRKLKSEDLTRLCLDRLKQYGPRLECVITLTEELALIQARRADAELRAGKYRGPLHGIPYAAKDLFAVKGVPTTWGAAPFTNQVFDFNATVINKLEAAGAVLVAKTTLGELAMDDTWFGGKTRNPWNLKEGSSGSSAGSCAATAAGLVPFALGSETYGSIVSPCDRCGVTGLRPTFGRVSRAGAMALSWSMDKIGSIARTVEDCALVFDAIRGPDGLDATVRDLPFNYDARASVRALRIGYLKADFEREKGDRKTHDDATLEKLRQLGVNLIEVELPNFNPSDISFVLSTEAAAAFDDLTCSGREDWLKQQGTDAWPSTFRAKRFVPAVEYLQAQRIRYLLVQEMALLFQKVDLFVAPSLTGRSLLMSNLTGHPCVVVPNGFSQRGTPTSICFIGKLFGEGDLLAVAGQYQDSTDFHRRHPPLVE